MGAVADCRFYSGGFNHTYRVEAVDGSIYYLRAYRLQWRTLADIQYELDLLSHLQRKDFPAARPVLYQDGQPFCTVPAPEGQRYVALFTEAPWARGFLRPRTRKSGRTLWAGSGSNAQRPG